MSRSIILQVVLVSSIAAAYLHYSEGKFLQAAGPCHPTNFQCTNGKCVTLADFCDRRNDCGDNSDEEFCDVDPSFQCPDGWTSCPNRRRCILSHWMCDGRKHCPTVSEETICAKKKELLSLFLRRRKHGYNIDRWGSEVHRTAVALFLADNSIFNPENCTDKKMSSEDLALHIHALLVACMDPRDFSGVDLVRELRKRVEASKKYTNPFLVLVLCNAGDAMTDKDVDRVTTAYDSQHRPFWTDYQALASMALSCISSRSKVSVDERILKDMLQELKKRQFRNGTVDNFRTTALVTQALFLHDSYKKGYDMDSAMDIIMDGLDRSKSLLTAYYVLPVLHQKSLLDVSSSHCKKEPVEEEEALQKILDIDGETITVQYSVWMGDEINLSRTWRLKMPVNSTVYNALETVAKVDNGQKVEYNVVDGKPYVAALNGKEDDPEMGMFWFVYLRTLNSDQDPKMMEESPVDVTLNANQEIILWYKRGSWNIENLKEANATDIGNLKEANATNIENLKEANATSSLILF